MPEARYVIQGIATRTGDVLTGPFLGRTETLADAFTAVGEAIEQDQGPDGKNLLYVIRDEKDDSRCWTIIEGIG
ncbi:MAG: hypothetical protein ACREMB_09890 [Candidatus Rokuibacteriota bacterium]